MIISTSGMLNGGPVMEYLLNLAQDEKNALVFVGYQADGTYGRRIQKGWREVPMGRKGAITIASRLSPSTGSPVTRIAAD